MAKSKKRYVGFGGRDTAEPEEGKSLLVKTRSEVTK